MWTLLLTLLLCVLPSSTEPVQDTAVERQGADTFEALSKEFDAAYEAWMARYRGAQTDAEREEVIKAMPQAEFTPRFLALAEAQPGSKDAYDALAWIHRFSQDRAAKSKAFALLQRDHAASESLAEFCSSLYVIETEAEAFLAKLVEASPHHAVRGQALHALAQLKIRQVGVAERLAGMDAEELKSYRESYGDETVDALRAADPAALRSAAESAFEKVAAEYGDLKSWRGSLKVSAERNLFELRSLAIGQVAPDISGVDIQDVAFKLSDYRGKVVVLDFWGHW